MIEPFKSEKIEVNNQIQPGVKMPTDPLKDVSEIAKAAAEITKNVPVYEDAFQPAAKQVGLALETVGKAVNAALLPVTALIWGADQLKDFVNTRVAKKLENIPPENIIPPKLTIAGPAIEALRYAGNDEQLADLYANLLATAMNRDTASGAHPAFVEIIKQLTSDEAKITKLFLSPIVFPVITVAWEYKNPTEGKTGGQDVLVNYSHIGVQAGCEFPDLTPTYLDNLCRLGLAEIPTFYQYTGLGVYDALENDSKVKQIVHEIDENLELKSKITKNGLKITSMGRQFVIACSG